MSVAQAGYAQDRLIDTLETLRANGWPLLGAFTRAGQLVVVFLTEGRVEEKEVGYGPFLRPSRHGFPGFWSLETLELPQDLWLEMPFAVGARGRGLHEVPLGPVRGDISESLAYWFTVFGDDIHALRLIPGFKRRHVAELMRGPVACAPLDIAERVTGTATLAHAAAFCQAAEAASGIQPAPELLQVRTVLLELERIYSHVGDIATLASACGTIVAAADMLRIKEAVLRFLGAVTGHRYGRGLLAPGTVRRPLALWGKDVEGLVARIGEEFSQVRRALDHTNSFLDRLHGAGMLPESVPAGDFTGYVAKSGGEGCDLRWDRPYDMYAGLVASERPQTAGQPDAFGRYAVRMNEVVQSLGFVAALAEDIDVSPCRLDYGGASVAYGLVEAPRGRLFYRLELSGGAVVGARLRTPSAVNWSAVPPAVVNGNILQDFPIIDASFNLAVSGLDL